MYSKIYSNAISYPYLFMLAWWLYWQLDFCVQARKGKLIYRVFLHPLIHWLTQMEEYWHLNCTHMCRTVISRRHFCRIMKKIFTIIVKQNKILGKQDVLRLNHSRFPVANLEGGVPGVGTPLFSWQLMHLNGGLLYPGLDPF